MSFLKCWQLRKQKISSNNAHENHLVQPGDDPTPPYGPENLSFDQQIRQPKLKKANKTEDKKLRSAAVVSLIDPFKKSKKKGVDGAHADGLRQHQQQKRGAKATPFSGKKVSWDAAATSFAEDTNGHHRQRKDSKGSYDYIDADECHDGVHAAAFYPIQQQNRGSNNSQTIAAAATHAPSSPQSRYDYVDFDAEPDKKQLHRQQRHQHHHHHHHLQQRVVIGSAAVPLPSASSLQRRATTSATAAAAAAVDEPLYATASSQIYSLGGSEDPYSSIVSIGGGYEQHGYSRIVHNNKNGQGTSKMTGMPTTSSSSSSMMAAQNAAMCRNNVCELDELYAKIDRKPSSLACHPSSTPSASVAAAQFLRQQSVQQHQPPSQQLQQTEFGGGGESGSGSICSSTQPSYRYLTVREDAAVVRERIRQREEQQQQQQRANLQQHLEQQQQERDDTYYSTIGNEYETVGDGSGGAVTANCVVGGNNVLPPPPPQQNHHAAAAGVVVPPLPQQNRLSLNVDFPDHGHGSASSPIPLPPTSPIPKLQPQLLQQQDNNTAAITAINGFPQHHYHHHHHHQQQQQQLSSSSSPTIAKVPMPPPPPPPPPFIRRPVVLSAKNSPSNGVGVSPLPNGERTSVTTAPLLATNIANTTSAPKKSVTSALRLSFFNGGSPLNFFNGSGNKTSEKSSMPPAPPTLSIASSPKATMAETNGLLNGTTTIVAGSRVTGHGCGIKNNNNNQQQTRHHSRIPIFFNRNKKVAADAGCCGVGGIRQQQQRTRTPSPAAAAAPISTAPTTTTTTMNCTNTTTTIAVGTQTGMNNNKNIHHQQQKRHHHFGTKTAAAPTQNMNIMTTTTMATMTGAAAAVPPPPPRDNKPSSSRRSSPLPVQVGQDYVSTIELSKKGRGGDGGGDQRAWPLSSI